MNPFNSRKKQLLKQKLSLTKYHHACFFIIIASFTILFLNHYIYHYHGFNYIVYNALSFLNAAVFLKIAAKMFEPLKKMHDFADDCIRLFACYVILMIATTAVQYTPFHLIDAFLYQHEKLPLVPLIDWTKSHDYLFKLLAMIYNSLDYALFFVPFLCIVFRLTHKVDDFCRYLIFTAIIGFAFYFFFPSCGPVHLYGKEHFLTAQANNYQKFYELHQGLMPSSIDGGMIACPSFHVLWAWGCTRCFFSNAKAFSIALLWFITISASTILLGWHYSIDVLTALFIILSYEITSILALKRSPY